MHICFCSPDWPPSRAANGIVTYTAAVRDYLVANGHDVSVVSRGHLFRAAGEIVPLERAAQGNGAGPMRALRGWASRRIDRHRGDLPGVGRRIAAQIETARRIAGIDLVEMEESFGWSRTVQDRAGIPVVTRLHGPYFLNPSGPRTRREERGDAQRCRSEGRAVRSARSLTAPTRAILDAACREYGRPPGARGAVIANPIAIRPEKERWTLAASEPGHILMVGRFDYRKGADTMLAAFERLAARHPAARLTLAGPDIGLEDRPGNRLRFAEYAREHLSPGARDRVTFLGRIGPEEIAALRRRAFVTVLASRYEIFSYALLEGFAAGCPMVSTDWPGSAEIVMDGRTGLLTPVGKPVPLADRLDWLLSRPEEAAWLAANGLQRCRETFSVEVVGKQMIDFYGATVAGERP
ncbi:MAG: glycosyltransferase family 4 protein [Sphingobium sp.]